MEDPSLQILSRILAESEIRVEKTEEGYCLIVEAGPDSFQSAPMSSKAAVEAACHLLRQLAGWSPPPQEPTRQTVEEAMPETMEELTRQITETARKRAREEVRGGKMSEQTGAESEERATEEPEEEPPEEPEEQLTEEPEERTAEEATWEDERKDRQWRENEVQRILEAIAQLRS